MLCSYLNSCDPEPITLSPDFLTSKCKYLYEIAADRHVQSDYYDISECKQLFSSQTYFRLFHLNCRRIERSYDDINLLFEVFNYPFDYVALTETWLLDADADLYTVDGYKLVVKQRLTGNGVGVCFYVKTCYDINTIPIQAVYATFEHYEIKIHLSQTNDLFSYISSPHTSGVKFLFEFEEYFSVLL